MRSFCATLYKQICTQCTVCTVLKQAEGHKIISSPITGLEWPRGFQEVKVPKFQGGGKVVSLTHRPPLSPGNTLWYSFLLEAESTPGP